MSTEYWRLLDGHPLTGGRYTGGATAFTSGKVGLSNVLTNKKTSA